jgi:hypothetical protein
MNQWLVVVTAPVNEITAKMGHHCRTENIT